MKGRRGRLGVATLGALLAAPAPLAGHEGPTRCAILVGPERAVTAGAADRDFYEPVLAIDPRDPRRMVLAAIEATSYGGGRLSHVVRPFFSSDGGQSWRAEPRDLNPPAGGAAAQVVNTDPSLVYRSAGQPFLASNWGSPNREHLSRRIASTGHWAELRTPFRNLDKGTLFTVPGRRGARRLYYFGMAIPDEERVMAEARQRGGNAEERLIYGVYLESTDDLQTWREEAIATTVDPVIARDRPAGIFGLNTATEVPVARNGSFYLSFQTFWGRQAGGRLRPATGYWLVRFDAVSVQFSAPAEFRTADGARLIPETANFWPTMAVDASGGPFDGRLYLVWAEPDGEAAAADHWKLQFSSSGDEGRTWRAPVTLERLANPYGLIQPAFNSPAGPNVEVNRRGQLLVGWYRFSAGPGIGARAIFSRRYATASVDGGRTFLAPVAVAGAESIQTKAQRDAIENDGWLGHYIRSASDPNGTFHQIWMDGRAGHQAIWHAPLNVRCEPARGQ